MIRRKEPLYYSDYLHLDTLTNCQHPESPKFGQEAHDETLFIITHQAYELWFKQILHELNSVAQIFSQDFIPDQKLSLAIARLERVHTIQQLFIPQLNVMETMRPMDFLEFRDLLVPASGFQSIQFREIEILFGLKSKLRTKVDRAAFLGRLSPADRKRVETSDQNPSLLELVQTWLERMPYTKSHHGNFWHSYESAVTKMLDQDQQTINQNPLLTPEQKTRELQNLTDTADSFKDLLDESRYQKLQNQDLRRFSQKAMSNALFIFLYREEPQIAQPFRLLNILLEIDGNLTTWRQRHALMAHRMLGKKIGTGGSSGHDYLKAAADGNRVYTDLYDIATFLIPRSHLPPFPLTQSDGNK